MTTRRDFVIGSSLALAAGGLPARALAAWVHDETFFSWETMAKGVFATHDQTTGGNVMVVVADGSALLVDTKFGPISPVLRREGESFGQQIQHVINTHHHGDHTGGNIKFTDSQVYANEKAIERILSQADRYQRELAGGAGSFRNYSENPSEDWMLEAADKLATQRSTFEAKDWAPGRPLKGELNEVAFANRTVNVHHVGPGHTDNDVFVVVPDANVIHAGDLLFNEMHPYFDPNGGGSNKGWAASLSAIVEACDEETRVVPGHGELTDINGVKKALAYQEQIRDAVIAEIKKGTPKEEVVEMSWDFMDGLGRERLKSRALAFVYDEVMAEG